MKRSEWVVGGTFDDFGICPNCGSKWPLSVTNEEFYFCPHCGRKMLYGENIFSEKDAYVLLSALMELGEQIFA